MDNIFFENWSSLLRVLIITVAAYFMLVVMLRVSGKRTLAKMNAFDFIVTIALGSTLATVVLNKGVPLANGLLALFLLIALQYLITWLSVRVKAVKRIVTCDPSLLLYKGEMLWDAMKRNRISVEALYVAARARGITDLKQVDAIVLETTGDISIIAKIADTGADSLSDVISEDYSFDVSQEGVSLTPSPRKK